MWARSEAEPSVKIAASGPDFLDYHDQSRSFSQTAVVIPMFTETLTGEGDPKLLQCTGVSAEFFSMLGVRPYMGRFYTPSEYEELGNPSIVLSYRFWKSQFGGDRNILGRVI